MVFTAPRTNSGRSGPGPLAVRTGLAQGRRPPVGRAEGVPARSGRRRFRIWSTSGDYTSRG